ncbi:MAG: hypothetical protein KTR31_12405 [Myxococcales bacterium]|nr:hypothetical protein [Myxococcales bacterium]
MRGTIAGDAGATELSAGLASSLERAHEVALAGGHAEVVVEHLVVALLEDGELRAHFDDRERGRLVDQLLGLAARRCPPGSGFPRVASSLATLLEQAEPGPRGEVTGAEVLAEALMQRGPLADVLAAHGVQARPVSATPAPEPEPVALPEPSPPEAEPAPVDVVDPSVGITGPSVEPSPEVPEAGFDLDAALGDEEPVPAPSELEPEAVEEVPSWAAPAVPDPEPEPPSLPDPEPEPLPPSLPDPEPEPPSLPDPEPDPEPPALPEPEPPVLADSSMFPPLEPPPDPFSLPVQEPPQSVEEPEPVSPDVVEPLGEQALPPDPFAVLDDAPPPSSEEVVEAPSELAHETPPDPFAVPAGEPLPEPEPALEREALPELKPPPDPFAVPADDPVSTDVLDPPQSTPAGSDLPTVQPADPFAVPVSEPEAPALTLPLESEQQAPAPEPIPEEPDTYSDPDSFDAPVRAPTEDERVSEVRDVFSLPDADEEDGDDELLRELAPQETSLEDEPETVLEEEESETSLEEPEPEPESGATPSRYDSLEPSPSAAGLPASGAIDVDRTVDLPAAKGAVDVFDEAIAAPRSRRSPSAGSMPAAPGASVGAPPAQTQSNTAPPPLEVTPTILRGRPARGSVVAPGTLIENIPRSMRVAVPVQVEVRLGMREAKRIADGLIGQGTAKRHDVSVTKAMSVRLVAPDGGFLVENGSPETQWVDNPHTPAREEYARWTWTVTPRRRGPTRLQLVVSARTVGEGGITADSALDDQFIDVVVTANYARSARRIGFWVTATLVGGALGAWGEDILRFVTQWMERL